MNSQIRAAVKDRCGGLFLHSCMNMNVMLWVTHCQSSEDPCIRASLFCQCIYHIMNEQLCGVLNLILENG